MPALIDKIYWGKWYYSMRPWVYKYLEKIRIVHRVLRNKKEYVNIYAESCEIFLKIHKSKKQGHRKPYLTHGQKHKYYEIVFAHHPPPNLLYRYCRGFGRK